MSNTVTLDEDVADELRQEARRMGRPLTRIVNDIVAGARVVTRLAAFGDEVIVGRDLLNRIPILLDGPRLRLRL